MALTNVYLLRHPFENICSKLSTELENNNDNKNLDKDKDKGKDKDKEKDKDKDKEDIKDKDIYVKLKGMCSGCKNSTITLKTFVETTLKHALGDDINIIEVK